MTTIAATRTQQSDRLAGHVAAHASIYYFALALIAIAAGWLARLTWSFWADEAATFWMSGGDWRTAVVRQIPGQSVLYSALSTAFHHSGTHEELWLRLPSVLGMLAAGYFLYRLTESIIGPGTGYLAVVPFFCTTSVILGATYARPYGLALAAAAGCGWKFYEFLKTGNRATFIQYLLFSVFVIYFQYLFAFLLALQYCYAIYWRRRGHSVPAIMFVLPPVLWILSLWPLRDNVISLLQFGMLYAKGTYTAPIKPTLVQFFLSFPVGPLLAAAVGCAAIAFAFPKSWKRPPGLPADLLPFLLLWAFTAPVLFFVMARLTSCDIFTSRYLLFVAPPFFILLAWLLSWIKAPHHRLLILFAILGGTVLHPGNLLQVYAGPAEDWRGAMDTVRQISHGEKPPVFVRSPFSESNHLDWQGGGRPGNFQLAPLAAYPVDNEVVPLPYFLTPDVQRFITEKLDGELHDAPKILLVAYTDADVTSWIQQEMRSRGYTPHLTERANFTVASFER